jgi:hypothetical protein
MKPGEKYSGPYIDVHFSPEEREVFERFIKYTGQSNRSKAIRDLVNESLYEKGYISKEEMKRLRIDKRTITARELGLRKEPEPKTLPFKANKQMKTFRADTQERLR